MKPLNQLSLIVSRSPNDVSGKNVGISFEPREIIFSKDSSDHFSSWLKLVLTSLNLSPLV